MNEVTLYVHYRIPGLKTTSSQHSKAFQKIQGIHINQDLIDWNGYEYHVNELADFRNCYTPFKRPYDSLFRNVHNIDNSRAIYWTTNPVYAMFYYWWRYNKVVTEHDDDYIEFTLSMKLPIMLFIQLRGDVNKGVFITVIPTYHHICKLNYLRILDKNSFFFKDLSLPFYCEYLTGYLQFPYFFIVYEYLKELGQIQQDKIEDLRRDYLIDCLMQIEKASTVEEKMLIYYEKQVSDYLNIHLTITTQEFQEALEDAEEDLDVI